MTQVAAAKVERSENGVLRLALSLDARSGQFSLEGAALRASELGLKHGACSERACRPAEGGTKASRTGGGGIRTRVRKHIPAGIYDAYPRLKCRSPREDTEKPLRANPGKSRRSRPRQP